MLTIFTHISSCFQCLFWCLTLTNKSVSCYVYLICFDDKNNIIILPGRLRKFKWLFKTWMTLVFDIVLKLKIAGVWRTWFILGGNRECRRVSVAGYIFHLQRLVLFGFKYLKQSKYLTHTNNNVRLKDMFCELLALCPICYFQFFSLRC